MTPTRSGLGESAAWVNDADVQRNSAPKNNRRRWFILIDGIHANHGGV
jgi:hypothetical protein